MRNLFRVLFFVSTLFFTQFAGALGFGQLQSFSGLGQPLRAETEILGSSEEVSGLSVRLASSEAFDKAGIYYAPALSDLRFEVKRNALGRPIVSVTTQGPVKDPFLNFLIEANGPKGRVVREYTILLDPVDAPQSVSQQPPVVVAGDLRPQISTNTPQPVFQQQQPAQAPVGAVLPPATIGNATRLWPPANQQTTQQQPVVSQRIVPQRRDVVPMRRPTVRVQKLHRKDQEALFNKNKNKVIRGGIYTSPKTPAYRGGSDSVQVRRGDTLGEIARRYVVPGVSLHQILVGIYRNNRRAFIRGNMNLVRAGSVLKIPGQNSLASVSRSEASRVYRAQVSEWREYREQLAGLVNELPDDNERNIEKDRAVTGQVTEVEGEMRGSSDKVQVTPSEKQNGVRGGAVADKKIEEIATTKAEKKELQQRVDKLKSVLKSQGQLLQLKVAELKKLQGAENIKQEVPSLNFPGEFAIALKEQSLGKRVERLEKLSERIAAELESKKQLISKLGPQDKKNPDQPKGNKVASSENGSAQNNGKNLIPPPPEADKPVEIKLPSEGDKTNELGIEARPLPPLAEPQPKPERPKQIEPPPSIDTPSFLDDPLGALTHWVGVLMVSLGALSLGILLLPLLLVIGWYFLFYRRKQNSSDDYDYEDFSELDPDESMSDEDRISGESASPNSVYRGIEEENAREENTNDPEDSKRARSATAPPPLTDFSQAGLGSIDTDDVDPIAEAEVYIAYGRDAQAEEILTEAMQKDPQRTAVHVKLLEIYAKRQAIPQFETVASELYAQTNGVGDDWIAALTLGREVDPENPLYQDRGNIESEQKGEVPQEPSPLARDSVKESAPSPADDLVASPEAPADTIDPFSDLVMEEGNALDVVEPTKVKKAETNKTEIKKEKVEKGQEKEELAVLDFDMDGYTPPEVPQKEKAKSLPIDTQDDVPVVEATPTAPQVESTPIQQQLSQPEIVSPPEPLQVIKDKKVEPPIQPAVKSTPKAEKQVDDTEQEKKTEKKEDPMTATAVGRLDLRFSTDSPRNTSVSAQTLQKEKKSDKADDDFSLQGTLVTPGSAGELEEEDLDFELSENQVSEAPGSVEKAKKSESSQVKPKSKPAAQAKEELLASSLTESTFDGQPMVTSQFDMNSIDLDLDASSDNESEKQEVKPVVPPQDISSPELSTEGEWDEVGTKIDLAKAYEEMGDMDGAQELLREVLDEGSKEQIAKAQTMLEQLDAA